MPHSLQGRQSRTSGVRPQVQHLRKALLGPLHLSVFFNMASLTPHSASPCLLPCLDPLFLVQKLHCLQYAGPFSFLDLLPASKARVSSDPAASIKTSSSFCLVQTTPLTHKETRLQSYTLRAGGREDARTGLFEFLFRALLPEDPSFHPFPHHTLQHPCSVCLCWVDVGHHDLLDPGTRDLLELFPLDQENSLPRLQGIAGPRIQLVTGIKLADDVPKLVFSSSVKHISALPSFEGCCNRRENNAWEHIKYFVKISGYAN